MLRPTTALLLDSDGTLIDSYAPTQAAWVAWAERHGLDGETVATAAHGVPALQHIERWAPWLDARAEADAIEHQEATAEADVDAFPGAAELLALRPGRVAVVTSGTRRLIERRFADAGLELPPALVVAEDIQRGKPDPEPYLLGAGRLGVEPADCLAVEDAPAGIASAAAAGCQVAAVAQTHAADALGTADAVFADLRALLAALAG